MSATTNKPERKYALTRLEAGDYLLPSNDGRTIWRIAKYTDDLSSLERGKTYWGAYRWVGCSVDYVDTEDWTQWELYEGWNETRRDAIDSALRAEGQGR